MKIPFFKPRESNEIGSPDYAAADLSIKSHGIEMKPSKANADQSSPQMQAHFYWQQLESEGLAYTNSEGNYVLAWPELYQIQNSPEQQDCLHYLNLPPVTQLTPIIHSHGALTDPDFQIVMEGWRDPNGTQKRGAKRTGGILDIDGQSYLLTETVWKLCEAIREFSKLTDAKSAHDNELHWCIR